MSCSPLLFQRVRKFRPAILRQPLLTTTPDTSDPTCEQIRECPGITGLCCFCLFKSLGLGQVGGNPINWGEAAGVRRLFQGSIQRVWYFKYVAHNRFYTHHLSF